MESDAEGFSYPRVDAALCTNCGACGAACPANRARPSPWKAGFAARSLDEGVRESSSSGGVFTVLAEAVLGRGGIVFGAALLPGRDGLALRHIAVEDAAGLSALRGSKYVQSDLGGAYAQVRAALDDGREALFSGTPCQVAGLYAVTGGPRGNLLTVDLVCHGAPSPLVFAAYLRYLEKGRGQRVTALSFRDKRRGWKDFCLAATFADGGEHVAGQTEDPYLIAFLRNLCLRPCCHACPFAGEKRPADLSLGDLWGARRVMPEADDDRGLSLVLVGSARGARAMEEASARLWLTPADAAAFERDNPGIYRAGGAHPRRAAFLRHVRRYGFEGAEAFFAAPGPLRRLAQAAKSVPGRALRKAGRRLGLVPKG